MTAWPHKLDRHAILPVLNRVRDRVLDYFLLTKPLITGLLLLTTLTGMVAGAGRWPDAGLVLWTLLGGALSAAGASALNQLVDRDLDRLMHRTQRRPLPSGRLGLPEAAVFSLLLCTLGIFVLASRVNWTAAALALVGMVYYVLLYSLVLKRTTVQNIVVGGGAGAIPPLVGWAAATGGLTPGALFLFAVIFFWTPPHFWALALVRQKDYARAGIPMLPVIQGGAQTRLLILLYTVQLVSLTMLLPAVGVGSALFLVFAALLGSGLLLQAMRLFRRADLGAAWRMYRYSSMYLALLFLGLMVDVLA
jgi:protoheme IX farnesyltransferase